MQNDAVRVLMRRDGRLWRFATIALTQRDGSIIFSLPRSGTGPRATWRQSLADGKRSEEHQRSDAPKGLKVTLHSSGRINYNGEHSPIFVDPIWNEPRLAGIVGVRIPALDRLDPFILDPDDEDLVIDVPDEVAGPFGAELMIAGGAVPPAHDQPGVTLTLLDRLHIIISAADFEDAIPKDCRDMFVYLFPGAGVRQCQAIGEDQALIEFNKALRNSPDAPMLRGPDGDGWYRLIFEVQMRIPPHPVIEAVDPNLVAEVMDQEKDDRTNRVQIRFRFREAKTRRVVKVPVSIARIELSSEL